ncbi:MAG: hypothetical protein Q7J46_04170 [Pseudomonas sp.]|nr:hypothetical protein [Pseudomonas sp.]
MFDDLAAYFYENIVASYLAYRDVREKQSYGRSKDTRAAVAAATALYHLREHIPTPRRNSRKAVASVCPDYDLLGDVVNAAKHKELDRGNPRLKSSEDIYEVTVSTQYEDAEGTYFDMQKIVVVKFLDGTEKDILDCLTNVMNYWGAEFARMGIIKSYKPFNTPVTPGEVYVSRDDAQNMDMEILSGVRFKQTIKLLKFNSETGRSVPVDLTGSEVSFRIYKPACVLDLHLSHPMSGKEYTFELNLDEDESFKWHSLKTDVEREDFVNRLATERQDEIGKLLAAKLAEESVDAS